MGLKKMILDIYKDSLEYSAQDWQTLVILGVISLFSFLLLPIFLLTGYNYRVINEAVNGVINGRDPLPDFEDIVDMFVDGVKLVVVQVVYFLIPVVIFLIFVAIAGAIDSIVSVGIMVVGCFITFIVGVLAYLMGQMGICHMIYNDGELLKAFAFAEIKKAIDEIGWFDCILTCLGLIIITVVLACVVSSIINFIFMVLGFSGLMLGVNTSGVFLLGMIINSSVVLFIIGPYLSIFNARSIGLLYGTHI